MENCFLPWISRKTVETKCSKQWRDWSYSIDDFWTAHPFHSTDMSCDASTIYPTLLWALGTWQSKKVTKYLPSWSLNSSGEWQKINQQTLMSGGDKCYDEGLPRWLSGKESSCQYRRYMFDPWSGKILHAAEQLSPCAATIEPVLWSLGPILLSPRVAPTEARLP